VLWSAAAVDSGVRRTVAWSGVRPLSTAACVGTAMAEVGGGDSRLRGVSKAAKLSLKLTRSARVGWRVRGTAAA
jgi:hypothetical protein